MGAKKFCKVYPFGFSPLPGIKTKFHVVAPTKFAKAILMSFRDLIGHKSLKIAR